MNEQQNHKVVGIVTVVFTIISLIVLFNVSALIGGFLYLLAFAFSLHQLKSKVGYEESFSIMSFVKNISKDNFWEEGIFTIIVILIPLIVIIATYRWIFVDTAREVNAIYNNL